MGRIVKGRRKDGGRFFKFHTHHFKRHTTRIKLSSGSKNFLPTGCRAMVGQVAGERSTKKPMLKAGNAYHKYRVKHKCWPKVRVATMNPVEHPHRGYQHLPFTRYNAPPIEKLGCISARRSGRLRGQAAATSSKAVEHPLAGGNHHYFSHVCIRRDAPPGIKPCLVTYRRTARRRGEAAPTESKADKIWKTSGNAYKLVKPIYK